MSEKITFAEFAIDCPAGIDDGRRCGLGAICGERFCPIWYAIKLIQKLTLSDPAPPPRLNPYDLNDVEKNRKKHGA